MACQYWYEGRWRSEEEFKNILNNGLIDVLLKDGKLNIPELEANPEQIAKFNSRTKKGPITIRIRHKIQTRINNERIPNTDGKGFPNKNPLDVIKKAIEEGGGPFEFKIAIKVGNEIRTGKGKANEALKQELEQSPVGIRENMKEGIPYMLIPSSYGWYPIQMKSHTIKDSKISSNVKAVLKELSEETENAKITAIRKVLEKLLYRTTVEFIGGKYVINQFDTKLNQNVTKEFANLEDANDFIQKQLVRIDYVRINQGTYNAEMANQGAVTTDLFSENGNFFNSSSFVLEAYQMPESELAKLKEAFDFTFDPENNNSTDISEAEAIIPTAGPTNNKADESPVFEAPIDEANSALNNTIVKSYPIPNTNSFVEVTVLDAGGIFTVIQSRNYTIQKRDNGNDVKVYVSAVNTGGDAELARKLFFRDSNNKPQTPNLNFQLDAINVNDADALERIQAVDELRRQSNLPSIQDMNLKTRIDSRIAQVLKLQEGIVEPETKPSIIQKAASTIASLATEQLEEGPIMPEQDLTDLLAQSVAVAEVTVPEDPIGTDPEMLPDSLFGDNNTTEDFDRDESNVKLRATTKTDGTKWSKDEELAELKRMMGESYVLNAGKKGTVTLFDSIEKLKEFLPKETYEMLLESRKQGKEIHGVFTRAAVYLSQHAEIGTSYHEAFHVVFTLALPLKTRIQLLNETYEKYKSEFPLKQVTRQDGTTYLKMPTYLELEEFLADKFMDYKLANEKVSGVLPESLAKNFKGLYRMLKVFFIPNAPVDIDTLFESINLGVYRKSIQFSNTRLSGYVRLRAEAPKQETAPDRKYDNPLEEEDAFEYMQTIMDEVLNAYAKTENLTGLTDKELIQKLGVHKMYSLMLKRLGDEYQANKNKGKIESAQRLFKLYSILTNNGTVIKSFALGDQIIPQFTKSTDLLSRFNYDLRKRGIYINYSGVKVIKETAQTLETAEENTFEALDSGEDTYEEAWMKGHIEINPMESVSQRLKSFFATIPKYKSNRKNSAKVINSFGVVKKENPGEIFKKLIAQISDSYTMAEMMQKLTNLNSQFPYIKHILEKLEQDPILKTELWANIASKHYATFSFAYEKDGEYSIVNSNRKTLDAIIKEELIAGFLRPTNKMFEVVNGETNYEKINATEAAKFQAGMAAVLQTAKVYGTNLTREQILQLFADVSRELKKYNFNLEAEDLETIWNPESGKASWANIINLFDTFKQIGDKLVAGENPFIVLRPEQEDITESEKTGNAKKKSRNIVESLAKQLLPALDREVVSSFRNIEGKTVYNLILSGFINKQMSTFKDADKFAAYLEEIKADPLMSKLPFIQDLANDDFDLQGVLDTVLLDGMSRRGKNRVVSYADMSDIELEATSMAFYWNRGGAVGQSKTSFFKLPIASNSPTAVYVKSINFSREEVIDRLVKTGAAELARIQNLKAQAKDSKLSRIVNFRKNGEKFQILEFLNGRIDPTQAYNPQTMRAAIEEFLTEDLTKNEFFAKQIAEYKKKGIITGVNAKTGDLMFAENAISKDIKNQTAFFKDYLLNTYYMNTQLTTILGGDPSFYKNTVNYQKRYKQVISPGMYSNTENIRTYYNAIIVKDSIVASNEEFVKHALEVIDKSDLTSQEKLSLKAFWTAKTKQEDGHNESDGATFITVERRKETMQSLGRWTPEHEAAMKRTKAGTETIEDLMLLNPPFKPEKPFVFTHRIVDGTVVPTQVKNAETVLTRSFALKKDASGKLLYPKLAAMFQDMEAGLYDTAIFESAMKEGGIVNKSGEFSDYVLQADGTYKLVEDAEIVQLKTEDWRLQQETPPHYVDERSNFGSQLRNLIIGDLNLEGDYEVNNQKMKGADVARLYQDLIVEDLKTSFEDVRDMFENPDGTINYARLAAELRKEVIERELGQDYLDALQPIESAIQGTTTALPLYHPLISFKMEAVMNSFFKNRVTKQKIAGGAFINTTSFGVSDQLKMKIDAKTGGITYEALLPAWSKQFFPKDKNGEVDIESLKKDPKSKDLLQILGYRIPTELKYSMFNIEVVGFTPPAMGGTVIMPVEITTIAGLDFDIDKLYFMTRAFKKNAEGKPEVIKYIESINSPQEAKELALNIFGNIKDFARFVKSNISSREEQQRYIDIHTDLLEKEMDAQTEAFKKENEEIYEDLKQVKILIEAAKKNNNAIELALHKETARLYYETLREQFVPFNESTAMVDPKSKQLVEFIEKRLTEKFDPISFNTKQARDNKKLDIMRGILENRHTTPSILSVGSFQNLKESAARVRLFQAGRTEDAKNLSGKELLNAADSLDNADFNINYPSTQLELFRRNMTGNQLIGIFANHNTHHAKAQFTNLQLANPIEFDNQSYVMLNQQKNKEGKLISKSLASGLAAVVDNASDPISSFINLNTYTTNTAALLMRAGVEEDTIWAFLNQPVILELTQKYFNDRGSLSDEKAFQQTKNKWKKALEDKLKDSDVKLEDIENIPLTKELLQANLQPSGTEEYYAVQYAVLQAFDQHYKAANELNQGVQASRVDTVGVGPTSSTNYMLLQKQTRVLARIEKEENLIKGAEEVFLGGSNQTMIPGFTKYGLHGPLNILNKIFPSIGTIDSNGQITYSAIGSLKEYFAGQKSSGILSEKEVRLLDVHFMDFIGSAFPFFNYNQSQDILTNMPERLQKFKENTPQDAPYRKFLDQLYVVDQNSNSEIRRIEYYTTGKGPMDTQRIKAAWERMLIDPNPEVKQMAWDLIKYTFFANGYGFGPHSFANLVPVLFWTNEYQLKHGIVDKSNRPFNDFLASALESDKLATTETSWKNRFINQFIRNNGTREGFVKTVKLDQKLIDTVGLEEAEANRRVGKAAQEAMGGIVKTTKGFVAVNLRKNSDLQTASKTPPRFIKSSLAKGKYQIYEFVGIKEFPDATWANMAIYKAVPTLGISNFILEYDFNNDIVDSNITKIKKESKPKSLSKTQMQNADAQLAAEMEAAEAAAMEEFNTSDLLSEMVKENPALNSGKREVPTTVTPTTQPPAQEPGQRKYTPENITTLQPNQVFVFGANTAGGHGGGTAGLAQRGTTSSNYTALPVGTKGKWAEYGVVDRLMQGTEGKSFGLVTKAANISGTTLQIGAKRSVPLSRIEQSINALIQAAKDNPNLEFLVTKFGTNMAGFTIEEMKSLLVNKTLPDNIILPKEFETRDIVQPAKPTAASSMSFLRQNADMSENLAAVPAVENALTETPVTYAEYQKLGGTLSAEEFVSLSTAEKNTLVWQLKNCK